MVQAKTIRSWLLGAVLLPGLASCQPQDGPVEPGDEQFPVINPAPKQVVRVSGTIAPTLDVKFTVHYEAADALNKGCWSYGPLWEGGGEQYFGEVLPHSRDGARYETSFVVDKYLPGHCDWRLIAVRAVVARKSKLDDADANVVIEGRRYDQDFNQPQCPAHVRRSCKEEKTRRLSNPHDDIPVQQRCQGLLPSQSISGELGLTCMDLWNDGYKKEHLLKPYTRHVEINFTDVDLEKAQDQADPETTVKEQMP